MRSLYLGAGSVVLSVAIQACSEIPPPPRTLSPDQWAEDNVAVGYLGHASVLIKMTGTFILTDPTFESRIGIGIGPLTLGPKRLVKPALPVAQMPRLSVVLISHAHFDSLDLPSLRRLPGNATLIAPPDCRDLLGHLGFADYIELAWHDRVTVDGVTIEALPVKHWGNRLPRGKARGYNAYLLSKGGVHVLFAPDTAYTPAFGRFRREGPQLAAAVFGNGAYDPWIRNHASPEQVWKMYRESGAAHLIPIHWDTFRLGKEPVGDAMSRLIAAAGSDADEIVIREIGGEWSWQHPAS